jgi:hypothetical protein
MTAAGTDVGSTEDTGFWMLLFAGTLLGLAGLMRLLDAFWAFRYKGGLPADLHDGLLGSSLKNYAWTWLIVGLVLLVSSFLIFARVQFARWVGYIAATIAALSAMAWIPYYPVWSLVYIAMAVAVFYALARYGGHQHA